MALPLTGIRVVEFGGLAPGPFCGLILADFGASVIRVDRAGASFTRDLLTRRKRSIAVNAKHTKGHRVLERLISQSDVVIDPFRPGVLERMNLGPKVCDSLSGGKSILARITGFLAGDYANMAGHDLNYLATIRPPGLPPIPPNNYLGDFAGGGASAALGIMMALFERTRSGKGQVVQADMVTGVRYLASPFMLRGRKSSGSNHLWTQSPGNNLLDGGAPFYRVYECSDGRFITLAALEAHFYETFLLILKQHASQAADYPTKATQHNRSTWPALQTLFANTFKTKSQAEWESIFANTDACVAPVRDASEVGPSGLGQSETEEKWSDEGGLAEPAPFLSRTPAHSPQQVYPPATSTDAEEWKQRLYIQPGFHSREVLEELGYEQSEIASLMSDAIVTDPSVQS